MLWDQILRCFGNGNWCWFKRYAHNEDSNRRIKDELRWFIGANTGGNISSGEQARHSTQTPANASHTCIIRRQALQYNVPHWRTRRKICESRYPMLSKTLSYLNSCDRHLWGRTGNLPVCLSQAYLQKITFFFGKFLGGPEYTFGGGLAPPWWRHCSSALE